MRPLTPWQTIWLVVALSLGMLDLGVAAVRNTPPEQFETVINALP